MARYIDADELIRLIEIDALCQKYFIKRDVFASIKAINTADVVPKSEYEAVVSAIDNSTKEFLKLHDDYQKQKSEVDKLNYTLLGVMLSVDKWLEGEELEQDEVNRAITMREKTLQIIENTKSDVAREIFWELKESVASKIPMHISLFFKDQKNYEDGFREGQTNALLDVLMTIDELEKKHIDK